MRKHTITALAAALCLLCTPVTAGVDVGIAPLVALSADAKLTSGDFTYSTEDDTVVITGCALTEGTVEIPDTIEGMAVRKIGATAFYGSKITGVVIPEGVTSIASGAFWHCNQLESVKLPSTLTEIEGFAFNDCQALAEIEFPESIQSIGNSAFGDTPWLAAQQEASPFVVVNGILIDASAAVDAALAANDAEIERQIEENKQINAFTPGAILMNQIGFFKLGEKTATYVTDAKEAQDAVILDHEGTTVWSGKTTPFGADKDSGMNVHTVDFTELTTPGEYTMQIGEDVSNPFRIDVLDDYAGLYTDAMNYFYQARSGIAIESEYITSGDKAELARDAGHAPDVATIQQVWGYDGTSGTQDVSGGWYDAGDHGKYVVNGGIALWTMQNQYERAALAGTADVYADGTMAIPENNNGYPDLLDEARWEMEWMLKMIVQDGDCAGMAYHKIHDKKWTGMGVAPSQDKQPRQLFPPTTAATLNLAACAAQSYRVWKDLDADFAAECLDAAKTAYAAAKAHPDMLAPLTSPDGGGPYGDEHVDDEFYWAACELYLSTGEEDYLTDAKGYKQAFEVLSDMGGMTASFDWGATGSMGSLSFLLHKDALPEEDAAKLTESVTAAADTFVTLEQSKGFGVPYQGETDKNGYTAFVWGSNSFSANNALVMAYAYDLSGDTKYLYGMETAMDYLLGRNPLDRCFVTGYGVHGSQYPHHRFYAKQQYTKYPKAPCGILVGGPNSNLEDDVISVDENFVKGETPALLCYLDTMGSYSTNECALNWNAPLVWVTSYLCEQNGGLTPNAVSAGTQLPEPLKEADIRNQDLPVTLSIPDGVTAIGEQVLGKKAGLVTDLVVPDSVTVIGKEAFYRCQHLTGLVLPETIQTVGDNAFTETPWLADQLEKSPLVIMNGLVIDGSNCEGDVEIPDGVTAVLGNAFHLNTKITSVKFPETVTRIGESSFYGCENLTDVKLPNSLKTIEQSAFAGTGLTKLIIPAGVQKIEKEAFVNCTALPEVTIKSKDCSIGTEAFGCTSTFTLSGQYAYIFVHLVLEDFVVNCEKGSTASAYANATGLKVNYIEATSTVDTDTRGDVNADTAIDIIDAILVNRYLLGGETLTDAQKKAADVDGNGTVDTTDSLNILKYVVEIISSFDEI